MSSAADDRRGGVALWRGRCRPSRTAESRPDSGVAGQLDAAFEGNRNRSEADAKLPLEAEFSDEAGAPVTLGKYFGPRPVVLALVYYRCPMLCTQVLNGLAGIAAGLRFAPQEYDVVVVSFDPGETPRWPLNARRTSSAATSATSTRSTFTS
jgi:protein SCO1/2